MSKLSHGFSLQLLQFYYMKCKKAKEWNFEYNLIIGMWKSYAISGSDGIKNISSTTDVCVLKYYQHKRLLSQ